MNWESALNQAEKYAVENFDKLPDTGGVSVRTGAAVWGCGTATMWRRIADGKLIAVRNGKLTRITVKSLRALMAVSA